MADVTTIFTPDALHKFFFFLSTPDGAFFKSTIEFIIFLLLSYMVISEFLQTIDENRKKELKYFMVAFVSLLINSLLQVIIYAGVLFTEFDIGDLSFFWPVVDRILSLITLVLLVNAFIYPVFRKKIFRFEFDLKLQILVILIGGIVVEISWILQSRISDFLDFWGNYFFVLLQCLIILYALYELLKHSKDLKYRGNIFLAFWVYMMVPLLHFFNIILFDNDSIRLRLLEQPFPVIAIFLLTQVTYLKLVDKAYLREKLTETEEKYKIEKKLSDMKDEFVSVVSHELRTPLTSVKLYLSLLENGKFGELNEKQREALDIVESESDRLSRLIGDILSLSKLESEKEGLRLDVFDMNDLKNPLYYAAAEEKDISVSFYMPSRFIVKADKAMITQVFVNLISNAIKFTDKGGSVTVSCEDLGREWSLSVADTGKGIAKKEIPKLFDKFYQVEEHMTRTKGGTGLGLSIVKKIVDMHNGRINVDSEIGKGSRFTVYIPKNL